MTFTQNSVPTYTGQEQTINLNIVGGLLGTDTGSAHVKKTNVPTENLTVHHNINENNYIVPTTFAATMNKADINLVTIHGDITNGISKEYTNGMGAQNITDVTTKLVLKLNGVTLSNEEKGKFNFVHYSIDNLGTAITTISLPNGGTTFVIRSNISGYNGSNFEGTYSQSLNQNSDVVYKFTSVYIGNNAYTIEDALSNATSGTVVVRQNTSFASKDVADIVYDDVNNKYHTVKTDVTLLLPFDSTYNTDTEVGASSISQINRNQYYVKLNITSNIELDVNGTLTINAKRGHAGTKNMGFINSSEYAILDLSAPTAKVNVYGTLNAIGFITGSGIVTSYDGSNVVEPMVISDFRGGTASSRVYDNVVPFNQFTVNNIETTFIINKGTTYMGSIMLNMRKSLFDSTPTYYPGSFVIVSSSDSSLFNLSSGYLQKQLDSTTGKVTFEVYGTVTTNNVTINALNTSIATTNKDLPLDGRWSIIAKNGSTITINNYMKFLPGSSLEIENGATLNISENARLTIYAPYEHIDEYNTYPNPGMMNYFRFNATNYAAYTHAKAILKVDGVMNVYGGLAGRPRPESSGQINFGPNSYKSFDMKYVVASAGDARIYTRKVDYFESGVKTIHAYSILAGQELEKDGIFTIVVIIKDEFDNPVSNQTVSATVSSGMTGTLNNPPTDANGIATITYKLGDNGESDKSFTITIGGPAGYSSGTGTLTFNFKYKAPSSGGSGDSPFLYSIDEDEPNFEHEPISYKMLKSVEGTSYGTIRLLQDQNGVYYIQVVEEGSSITVLDNVQLYAVDYIDDGTILDLFFDILGNPHTIREKLTPVTFTDQYGISYLDEIISLDGNVAAPDTTRDDVLTYLTATFNKPENADFAKLMVSVMDGGSSQTVMMEMFSLFNAPQNLWWLDQALAHQDAQPLIQNVFNSIHVKVQVWDGIKWIDQGLIEAGSYLMEEFLVPIDLTGIETENLIVRFVFPTKCAFMFDSVAIDFTPDSEMNIIELDLISAIMNGNVDVIDKVMSINGEYVTLDYKEDVTFGFAVPALQEGYSRGFGVSMTGYIYAAGCTVTDELQPLMEGKTFEEIVDIIIASGRQELIDDIEMVSNFYYTITALGSLEYEDLLRELFNFMPQEE